MGVSKSKAGTEGGLGGMERSGAGPAVGGEHTHRIQFLGFSQAFIAAIASLAWMAVSSGLILLNKRLLSTHGFAFPLALAGLGMAASSVLSYLCCKVFKIVEARKTVTTQFYLTRIMPVGFLMAATLAAGNLAYLYLTVALIQMLKSLTPVLTMLALFVARLETPTQRLVLSVSIITLGTAIASAGEVNLSVLGLIIMLLSECAEAGRLVMTQLLLVEKFHPIEGLMYLAPACTIWLYLGSLLMELSKMRVAGAFMLLLKHPVEFAAAAGMGFLVNSLAYIVIQTASSPTLKVLGTVKNGLVVVCGIILFHETVTWIQGVGYAIAIGAFFWYNEIKAQEMRGPLPPGGSGKATMYTPVPSDDSRAEEGQGSSTQK